MRDFASYSQSTGDERLSLISRMASQGDYTPARDYWKQLREGLIRAERAQGPLRAGLDAVVSNATASKRANYAQAAAHWRHWREDGPLAGGTFVEPRAALWPVGDLVVRINPAVALVWPAGSAAVVALHYDKTKALPGPTVRVMLRLMQRHAGELLAVRPTGRTQVFVVEVCTGEVHTPPTQWPDHYDAMLDAEAGSMATLFSTAA